MRQIYTSPRMENIDRVVALMAAQGIETRISNQRGYKGGEWKRFSYTDRGDRSDWPQVCVVRSEDQTAARRILREAGLEPATRFADELAAARADSNPESRRKRASMRIKLVVLALIAAVATLITLKVLG